MSTTPESIMWRSLVDQGSWETVSKEHGTLPIIGTSNLAGYPSKRCELRDSWETARVLHTKAKWTSTFEYFDDALEVNSSLDESCEQLLTHNQHTAQDYFVAVFVAANSTSHNARQLNFYIRQPSTTQSDSKPSRIQSVLANLHLLCRSGKVDAAVDTCFEIIEGSFALNQLAPVNELLFYAEPDKLDHRVTVGMLRASSRAKRQLSAWQDLLDKERIRLQRERRNEERILRGLLPKDVKSTSANNFAP